MTTATVTAKDRGPELVVAAGSPAGVRHRHGQMVAFLATLGLVAAGIVGARIALHPFNHRPPGVTAAHRAVAFPSSPAVEAVWGMRFTNVLVLADNGGVELRYQVIDDAKAAKIHQAAHGSNELPTITVEGTDAAVAPSSVLMHFHHGDATAGRTYSIIYGNAGGALSSGELVTIVMKDGLKIQHVEVSD